MVLFKEVKKNRGLRYNSTLDSYSVDQGFGQAKLDFGGLVLGLSQFLLWPQQPGQK